MRLVKGAVAKHNCAPYLPERNTSWFDFGREREDYLKP